MTQISGNGHKRAVLYARVSTDDQKDKGYSLPSQFDAMRKYAAHEGFEIVAEYQDDYSGATPIEHRPEGRKAYTMLQSGDADAIIAYTIDRFVRPPEDGDEWEMPILIRGLAKSGKEIHTCDIGKLKTDFVSLLLVVIGAKSAGEERRKIRERSMRGKEAKAKSGNVVVCGHAPYGYTYSRDAKGRVVSFEIVEEYARIVRLIFRWYVRGDESGVRLSARGITRRLSQMRIPTPGEAQKGYARKRGAGIWNEQAILQIIGNEVYAGVWRFGVVIGHTNNRRPLEESTSVIVPSIIDRDLWERAQAQRKKNRQLSIRNCKREYLLRGLIKCNCGAAMSGQTTNRGTYYVCTWQNNSARSFDACQCTAKWLRADAIEADVWDEIHELFSNLDRLWAELKQAQACEEVAQEPIREKLEITEGLIRHAEGEADKIARALRDAEKDGAVFKSLKRDEKETNAQLASLATQREKLQAELKKRKTTDEAIETIMQFARRTRKGIDRAIPKEKRHMLETLDVKVRIKGERYKLNCILGETGGEIRKIDRRRKGGVVATLQARR